jgi:PPOX class probable F420-dependent enzyme
MAPINPEFHDLFQKKTFAHLSTLMPDGSPQASPVWIDLDGEHVLVNSAQGRLKDKNMRRDPRVALSLTDPDNPYRALMIRGKVVDITTDGADAHIDALAKRYLGQDRYPYRGPDEVRVIYRIEPTHVSAMG